MQGFPKYLNTKQDYLNCLQDFPEETKKELQNLIDSRYSWTITKVLAESDAGVTDNTHKVIENNGEKLQYEYVEDNNAKIFRLDFTVNEVKDLINA